MFVIAHPIVKTDSGLLPTLIVKNTEVCRILTRVWDTQMPL